MAIITALPTVASKVIPLSLNVLAMKDKELSLIHTGQQFFTTDTDAWLRIAVGDLDLTGTTSNLTLVNLSEGNTGSIISKEIAAQTLDNQKYFFYEISEIVYVEGEPDRPVLHAGDWLGQIIVTKGGENITSCRFQFKVKGHLLDGNEVGLIMIDDIAALKANVTLLNDLIAGFQVNVSDFQSDSEALQQGFQDEIDTIAAAELLRITLYNQVKALYIDGLGGNGDKFLKVNQAGTAIEYADLIGTLPSPVDMPTLTGVDGYVVAYDEATNSFVLKKDDAGGGGATLIETPYHIVNVDINSYELSTINVPV